MKHAQFFYTIGGNKLKIGF